MPPTTVDPEDSDRDSIDPELVIDDAIEADSRDDEVVDDDDGDDDGVDDAEPEMADDDDDHDDDDDDDDVDDEAEWLQQHRLDLAQQRASAIAAGRRKAGMAGAVMAGAMLAMRDALEGPPKDDMRVEAESPTDPIDLDSDGFEMTVDGVDVEAPPLERLDPARYDRKKSHR